MKKLIFILALLLMAAPAWSQVAIDVNSVDTYSDEEDPNISVAWVEFKYDADLEDELVRAFALEISVTGPNAFVGWAESLNEAYGVAPGGVEGMIAVWPDDNEGTMITEQASLYNLDAEDGIQPDPNGMLFAVEVGGDQGETICVTVGLNVIRGGIVMEDATEPDGAITITGGDPCCITLAEKEEPEPLCGDINEVEMLVWEGWGQDEGEPNNWCESCFKCGDINKDGFVSFADVQDALDLFIAVDTTGWGDYNMDGFMSFADVQDLLDRFIAAEGCTPCEE